MNVRDEFVRVLQGGPDDLRALETEISVPLLMDHHRMDAQTQADIEDLIVDAILRRNCNPIQMHLRLKKGFNATFAYDELNELPTSAKKVARELARFYVRIADLRARILQEMQEEADAVTKSEAKTGTKSKAESRLQRAYTIQLETMQNKQRENKAQLDRMLRAIVSNPDSDARCINEAVTLEDLDALELQLQDVVERGCAANELRCLKIREAEIELKKYEALMAELQQCE